MASMEVVWRPYFRKDMKRSPLTVRSENYCCNISLHGSVSTVHLTHHTIHHASGYTIISFLYLKTKALELLPKDTSLRVNSAETTFHIRKILVST